MTAEQILAISRPADLFSCDTAEAKKKYHALAKEWHPDVNNSFKADLVFSHIKKLYDKALEHIELAVWEDSSHVAITTKSGVKYSLPYQRKHDFELGVFYVGLVHVTYMIDAKHKALFDNFLKTIKTLKFSGDRMKEEFNRLLPHNYAPFEMKDGRFGLQIPKTPDMLLLKDVLEHYGQMDPKHVAWIQSRLLNISCYLKYTDLAHNNIALDTCFISPEHHSVALLGGWWYTAPRGQILSQMPARTFNLLPWDVRSKKKASTKTDRELIRALGRELLGDLHGIKVHKETPTEMLSWLRSVSTSDSIEEYGMWNQVLDKSFGKRKFTVMDLSSKDIYGDAK